MSKIGRTTRWMLGTAVFLALLALAARRLDLRAVAAAITHAQARWLIAAAVAALLCSIACGMRLVAALRLFAPELPIAPVLATHVVSSAAQQVLPTGAGELVRTSYLVRRMGVSLRFAINAQVVDRVVDAAAVALLATTVMAPRWVALSLAAASALMLSLPRFRRFAATQAWALCNEIVHSLSLLWVLRAAGLAPTFALAVATVVGLRVAALVPALPAQLGVLEGVFVVALHGNVDVAIATAVLYRVAHGAALGLAACIAMAVRRRAR